MLGHVMILYILMAAEHVVSGGGEAVPIRVNGLINQSVLLSPSVDKSRHVQLVFWNFQYHIMASVINGQLTVIKDEFKGRLEILDEGRSLRIGQLMLDDSGLYTTTMMFMDNTKLEASFTLTVYEPVPKPSIAIDAKENTSDWCNVTLRCSVPRNTSSLSYTWKRRHEVSDYQLYDNSTDTIQMSLQPQSWNMEVLCIVQNPSDRKNVSLQKFCSNDQVKGDNYRDQSFLGYFWVLLASAVLMLFLALIVFVWIKKQKRGPQNTGGEEIFYADLRHQQRNVPTQALVEDVNAPDPSETIEYSTLKPGT